MFLNSAVDFSVNVNEFSFVWAFASMLWRGDFTG